MDELAASGAPNEASATDRRLTDLAERIRRLRLERGFRLTDLASLSGLSEAHLYRLEQGERWPSVPALLALADVYAVSPSVLLDGSPQPRRTAIHRSGAKWHGTETAGSGVMTNHSVSFEYDRKSRLTADHKAAGAAPIGTPEEMIGMALAGCFSMSLAQRLDDAGFTPRTIKTSADVLLGISPDRVAITEIRLVCDAQVTGIDEARFEEIAQITKRTCVVARALVALPVTLEARLTKRGTSKKETGDGDQDS